MEESRDYFVYCYVDEGGKTQLHSFILMRKEKKCRARDISEENGQSEDASGVMF